MVEADQVEETLAVFLEQMDKAEAAVDNVLAAVVQAVMEK